MERCLQNNTLAKQYQIQDKVKAKNEIPFRESQLKWILRKIELLRRIRELILVTDMVKQAAFIEQSHRTLASRQPLSLTDTLKLTLKCAGKVIYL